MKIQKFSNIFRRISTDFGGPDCPPIAGAVAPIAQSNDAVKLCGKNRGIQGHHNSCYLDATLFSMFTFTRYGIGGKKMKPSRT